MLLSCFNMITAPGSFPPQCQVTLHQHGFSMNIHDCQDFIHQQSIEHSSAAELHLATWLNIFSTFISAEIKPCTSQTKIPTKADKAQLHLHAWLDLIDPDLIESANTAFAFEWKDTITEWGDNLAQVFCKTCPSYSCAEKHHFHIIDWRRPGGLVAAAASMHEEDKLC